MKYDEVPKNYHSPYMVQVAEKLNILKMTQEERANYSYYQKKLYNDRDELQAAEARGKEEGIEIGEARGKTEGKTEIALAMLLDGDSAEKVARITGLSIADIQKLRS
jgi:predicted transposase/invertase (TIGR01784 family)